MTIPHTADGVAILDEVCDTLKRFVVLPSPEAADAYTLWIAATHRQDAWEHATRFVIKSPIKRCGKTRAQEVGRELAHKPLATANISVARLVRSIDETDPPTLFLDEADLIFGERKREKEGAQELRGILNSGHARGVPYMRWDQKARKPEDCPSFAMALIAGIGDLPDTLEDRAVVISMRRRAPGETIQHFRRRRVLPRLHDLRERLHEWAVRIQGLAEAEPLLPVEDRAADNWEPLVAIADAAGGDWPRRARFACKALSGAALPDEVSSGERLLADLLDVWTSTDAEHTDPSERREHTLDGAPCVADALHTTTLLERLTAIDEAPWGAWYGHPLTPRELARFLRQYNVRSKTVRIGDAQAKGYHRADLADSWLRYVPGLTRTPDLSVPASQSVVSAGEGRYGSALGIRPTSVPAPEGVPERESSVPALPGRTALWDAGTAGTDDPQERVADPDLPALSRGPEGEGGGLSVDVVERLCAVVAGQAGQTDGPYVDVAVLAGEEINDDEADKLVEELLASNGRLADRGIIVRPVPGHPSLLNVHRRAGAREIARDVLGPAGLGPSGDRGGEGPA